MPFDTEFPTHICSQSAKAHKFFVWKNKWQIATDKFPLFSQRPLEMIRVLPAFSSNDDIKYSNAKKMNLYDKALNFFAPAIFMIVIWKQTNFCVKTIFFTINKALKYLQVSGFLYLELRARNMCLDAICCSEAVNGNLQTIYTC